MKPNWIIIFAQAKWRMKYKFMQGSHKKTQTQFALSICGLSCLLLFSCNSDKQNVKNEVDNPRAGVVTKEKIEDISGQMLDPCQWSYQVEQNSPDEATLIATAKLDSGWHLYSQKDFKEGPLPMAFTFDALPEYKLIGATEEEKLHKEHDPFFGMEIYYFEKEAIFKQKIKILSQKEFAITGTIDYMTCLTQCVIGAEDFSFNVKGNPQ